MEETVGGNKIDFSFIRPMREQRLQNPRRSAFTYRNTAGDADNIRDFRILYAKKTIEYRLAAEVFFNVIINQTSER